MKQPNKEQPDNTTLPTDELLYIILGDEHSGNEHRTIPPRVSAILYHKLKNSLVYKVVLEEDGSHTLWWYNAWYNDTERRRKMKEYSEKLRVEGWLLSANVADIARAIQKSAKVGQSTAEQIAYSLIKNPNGMLVIKDMFGINKLKEKVEEL